MRGNINKGMYINYFSQDLKKDVFIIINENNGKIKTTQYMKAKKNICDFFDSRIQIDELALCYLREQLMEIFPFGVQTVIKKWEN